MELRDYQHDILNRLRHALASGHKRPVVQAPTGSGKTVIAAELINLARRKGKRVLFCVPALSLIDQTVERFRQNSIFDIGVIQANHDMTDIDQPVQICSVQTLARRTLPKADLVIVDEAHLLFKLFDKWMPDPEWRNVPFIGLTATPWSRGMGAEGRWDHLIVGITTAELIERKALSPFKVFAPGHPNLEGVKTMAGDYDLKGLGAAMDKGALVADIVSTWLERGNNQPTICFAVNRLHAKHIQLQFQEAGVAAEYMDAYTDLPERRAIIDRFSSGETKIICNVGVLTTGFDADVRCIILARPTKSEILYTQMIGRGLRTADGKDHCIILDHSDTTLRLGFVTDIYHDTLDDGKVKRSVPERKEPLPKECKHCHFLKPPKVLICPACGHKPTPQDTVETADGELVEMLSRRAAKKNQKPVSNPEHWFSQFVLYAKMRGYYPGWAYWAYQDKFHSKPPHHFLNRPAEQITPEVEAWIRYRNIRKAKAKNGRAT
jgi:superfamily II DNA or RNA helicase